MGGATIAINSLVEELTKYGIDPIIAIPSNENCVDDSVLLEQYKKKQWDYEQIIMNPLMIPGSGMTRLLNPLRYARSWIRRIASIVQIITLVKKYNVGIIHTNTGVIQEGYYVSSLLKIPHVWHIREYQDKDFGFSFFPSKNDVARKFCNSFSICITKDIQKHFDLDKSYKSIVIHDPIFSMKCFSMHIKEKQNYFIVANRISKEKGIEPIVNAFSVFVKESPGYRLKIAGGGEAKYIQYIRQHCVRKGISNKVDFLGYVDDIKPLLCEARALLVGSYHEGFGMMTAEAIMMGCLVIGRNSAGTSEIVSSTDGGVLYDNDDEILQYMRYVSKLRNEEYEKRAEYAMIRAWKLYNSELSGKRVFDFYNMIIRR